MAGKGKTRTDAATLASFLNYNRSINPSEAAIYAVSSSDEAAPALPVAVRETTVRGSISNFGNVFKGVGVADSSENIAKQLDPENANPQRIDIATLPLDRDRFRVAFTLSFRAESRAPAGCNDAAIRRRLVEVVDRYAALGGYDLLGARYAWRLVCGGWLWRNRYAVDKTVTLRTLHEAEPASWSFAIDGIPADRFPGTVVAGTDFRSLASAIGGALAGTRNTLFLSVTGEGTLAAGQEVYPSQEFVGDGTTGRKGKQKGQKSKTLSSIRTLHDGAEIRQATIHSQKIGNALRCIDEWHGQAEEYGAIAIEPYGYVQSRNTAIRLPNRDGARGFYEMLLDLPAVHARFLAAQTLADLGDDDHYFVAVLIRGGVFSAKDE